MRLSSSLDSYAELELERASLLVHMHATPLHCCRCCLRAPQHGRRRSDWQGSTVTQTTRAAVSHALRVLCPCLRHADN